MTTIKQRILSSTAAASCGLRSVPRHNFLCRLGSRKKSFNVNETMADIEYQAYFGKLFEDNQNAHKKNISTRSFTLNSVRIANEIADEMHRNQLPVARLKFKGC